MYGSYTVQLTVSDEAGAYGTTIASIPVTAAPFQVVTAGLSSPAAAPTGFSVQFNRAADMSVVNLSDFAVSGPVTAGSLLWNATSNTIQWVASTTAPGVLAGGILPAGTYTVTLKGWQDARSDSPLLGGDGTAGDAYVGTYTVAANNTAPVVYLPDFARGPQDPVNRAGHLQRYCRSISRTSPRARSNR